MIPTTTHEQKHYRSARERFLEPALLKFVEREFPQIGGPFVIKLFVEKILEQIDQIAPLKDRIKPGQIVWNALDKNTPARHPKRKTKSIILTLVTPEEIEKLIQGEDGIRNTILQERLARICNEAYKQDALLSMRDSGLIFGRRDEDLSIIRIAYEKKHNIVLPHTGSLHDQGTTLTHKAIICKKVKQDKKDPTTVAKETNHSQRAVDIYLRGYERVKALIELEKPPQEISFLTGMSKHLINQYEQLIKEIEPPKVDLST